MTHPLRSTYRLVGDARRTRALLWLGIGLAAVAGVVAVRMVARSRQRRAEPVFDYSDRRGLPLPPDEMRGLAPEDFDMPEDMRTPLPLRPYATP